MTFLAWLHAQAQAVFSTIAAVAANQPAPARQVLVYTLVPIVIAWAVLKIAKKVK